MSGLFVRFVFIGCAEAFGLENISEIGADCKVITFLVEISQVITYCSGFLIFIEKPL